MNVNRSLVFCSHAEDLQDFPARRRRCVGDSHSHRQSATLQAYFDSAINLGEFLRCSLAVRRVCNRKKSPRIVHHFHAHGNVADARAKINQRFPFPRRVPAVDVVGPSLEFQRCRHSVVCLVSIFLRCLPMFVQIDKTGCHH